MVSEGERIGVIGPNGSGKSTLLEILSGRMQPDNGDLAIRKGTHLSLVRQVSDYEAGETVHSVLHKALDEAQVPEEDRAGRMAAILGRAGFHDLDILASTLSGGWRKRLAIVEALVRRPDVLLLDEPTNHLDLAGIDWLESVLQNAPFACVVVSHDRYFLENVANEIVEINPAYENGLVARVRKLQRVSGSEGRISACATQPPVRAGKPRAYGNRMVAARPEGAHHEIQGAHRQGAPTDRRTGGHERADTHEQRANRFFVDRTAKRSSSSRWTT